MRSLWLFLGFLSFTAFGVLPLCGCNNSVDTPQPVRSEATWRHSQAGDSAANLARDSAAHAEVLSRDVGKVIAGQVVSHTFEWVNKSAEVLRIREDDDIQRNCGCSAVEPQHRVLAPGGQTSVKVKIYTAGRSGPFEYGGTVIWTSEAGTRLAVRPTLRGEAVPPLKANTQLLNFGDQDIRGGISKQLTFSENFPVDWKTLQIISPSDAFVVTDVTHKGQSACCKVVCRAPDGVSDIAGELYIYAQTQSTPSNPEPLRATLVIGVRATQAVDLAFSPKIVPLAVAPDGDRATARLALRGERLKKGRDFIKSIKCEGFLVDWKLGEITRANVAILELTLTRTSASSIGEREELLVETMQGDAIRVPLVCIHSANAASGR